MRAIRVCTYPRSIVSGALVAEDRTLLAARVGTSSPSAMFVALTSSSTWRRASTNRTQPVAATASRGAVPLPTLRHRSHLTWQVFSSRFIMAERFRRKAQQQSHHRVAWFSLLLSFNPCDRHNNALRSFFATEHKLVRPFCCLQPSGAVAGNGLVRGSLHYELARLISVSILTVGDELSALPGYFGHGTTRVFSPC